MTEGSSIALPRSSGSLNGLSSTSLAALFLPMPGRASRADRGIELILNGCSTPVIER